jgi:hypothetical protein
MKLAKISAAVATAAAPAASGGAAAVVGAISIQTSAFVHTL